MESVELRGAQSKRNKYYTVCKGKEKGNVSTEACRDRTHKMWWKIVDSTTSSFSVFNFRTKSMEDDSLIQNYGFSTWTSFCALLIAKRMTESKKWLCERDKRSVLDEFVCASFFDPFARSQFALKHSNRCSLRIVWSCIHLAWALLRSECFLRPKSAKHCVLWWNKKKAEVEEEEEEYQQERKKKIRWWRTQRVHKPTERVVCENYMYRLVEYWTNTRRAPIAFYYYYNNIEWQANEVRQAAATAKHETKTNLTS